MSDISNAPAGGADTPVSVPVSTPASSDNTPITAREAASQLSNWRFEQANPDKKKSEPAVSAERPTAAPETDPVNEIPSGETDAQPETADPVEPTHEAEPEATPPIEPPRSWTKEDKAAFEALPREVQQRVADRERAREVEIRRGQNEAADKLKGLTAKEQQVEQARQQYEAALPALLQTLQTAQSGEFSDIRTQEDVNRMAGEDWPRFARWQAHMMQVGAVEKEVKAVQDRQAQEFESRWSDYATKEDAKLIELVPELADKAKATKIADSAAAVLRDVGFGEKELGNLWTGKASVSLRDARLSQIIIEAAKYREAKANAAKPAAKPIPAVQRPGVSKAPASANDAEIQNLEKAFERNPNPKTAAALTIAKRRTA